MILRIILYKENLLERRYTLISDSELLKLLHNKPELDLKMMMGSYMPIIFNNISSRYSKEDIEKYGNINL
jgi:hypothetical protein